MYKGNLKPFICAFVALLVFGSMSARQVFADDDSDEFDLTGTTPRLPNPAGFRGDGTVGGRTVHVTSATHIDQDEGTPAVGKTVEVEGVLQNGGTVNEIGREPG